MTKYVSTTYYSIHIILFYTHSFLCRRFYLIACGRVSVLNMEQLPDNEAFETDANRTQLGQLINTLGRRPIRVMNNTSLHRETVQNGFLEFGIV